MVSDLGGGPDRKGGGQASLHTNIDESVNMKFTRKQKATFKKLHPEAVCPLVIKEAEGMYERGMSYAEVCRRVKHSLTVRQQLPWIKPKYNPERYPKIEAVCVPVNEDDLLPTAQELMDNLPDYAREAKRTIDVHEMDLNFGNQKAQEEALAYFKSKAFDFHLLLINCHNLFESRNMDYWINADAMRRDISLKRYGFDFRLHQVGADGPLGQLGTEFFRIVKSTNKVYRKHTKSRYGASLIV